LSLYYRFIIIFFLSSLFSNNLPKGFVYIDEVINDVDIDIRYSNNNNFIGKKINGYNQSAAIGTKELALALQEIQNDLKHFGYGVKIFDAYRPQKAVNHFSRWSTNDDVIMKDLFYPNIEKRDLFKEGYIASRSGHSRGSTIDLTIINLKTKEELDMGTSYDFFGVESSYDYSGLTYEQNSNRLLLYSVMKKYGFKSLKSEWWHFTLENEPFPDTYFNFNVE
tara:strand:- start:1918 stop:2583 length:666 start_codon:yes stop_codon:yes gene_type:complete